MLLLSVMASVAVNTSLNVNIDFELAGVDKRILAWVLDLLIRLTFIFATAILFKPAYGSGLSGVLYMLALLFPIMFYYLLFELLMNGQTPGKMILKIKVVSLEGYKPTYLQYLNRWIFRIIDTGFITIIFFGLLQSWVYGMIFLAGNLLSLVYIVGSKKEQRIGDLVANTVVIRLTSKTKIGDTIFTNIQENNYKMTYPAVLKLSDRDISIIKNALANAVKLKRSDTLWNIATRIKPVINADSIDDPYVFLNTVMKDYNYITTR